MTEGVKFANALKLERKKTLRSCTSSITALCSVTGAEGAELFLLNEMEGKEIEGKLKLGSIAEDLWKLADCISNLADLISRESSLSPRSSAIDMLDLIALSTSDCAE